MDYLQIPLAANIQDSPIADNVIDCQDKENRPPPPNAYPPGQLPALGNPLNRVASCNPLPSVIPSNMMLKNSCQFCGKYFTRKFSLKRHYQRKHPSQQYVKAQFPCGSCEKKFSSRYSLKLHFETFHLPGAKSKFSCQHCSKRFTRKSALTRHTREQHEEADVKPYNCRVCRAVFSRKQHLDAHVQRVHGL